LNFCAQKKPHDTIACETPLGLNTHAGLIDQTASIETLPAPLEIRQQKAS